MHESGSSAGANQKMGYIIDGVADAGTHYLVANNHINATDNTGGGGTFTTQPIAVIDGLCAAAGFAADPTTVADELCHYNNVSIGSVDRYMRGVKTHTVGTPATGSLKSPLWYAAKWGGYKDLERGRRAADRGMGRRRLMAIRTPISRSPTPASSGPQLSKAFNEIIDRNSSASSASVNSGSISSESRVYQAVFNSRGWTGELLAFKIDPANGALDAGLRNGARRSRQDTGARQSRSIFTLSSAGAGIAFTWTGINGDATRKAQLDPTDRQSAGAGHTELPAGRRLEGEADRQSSASAPRSSATSSPLRRCSSGRRRSAIATTWKSTSYFAFRDGNARPHEGRVRRRQRRHAACVQCRSAVPPATTGAEGDEMFAYVPGAVFKNLDAARQPGLHASLLRRRRAEHGRRVLQQQLAYRAGRRVEQGRPGHLRAGHHRTRAASAQAMCCGNSMMSARVSGTIKGDPDLGYTYSRPAIVRLNNSKWAAIFGNGYNNSENDGARPRARLDMPRCTSSISKTAADPEDLRAGRDRPPLRTDWQRRLPWTSTATSIVDYVYAGDLLGNMWKFDLTGTNTSDWKRGLHQRRRRAQPLYVASGRRAATAQPITSRPEVGRGPNGNGMVILFGTGKFLEDPTDRQLATAVRCSRSTASTIRTAARQPTRFTGRTDCSADDHSEQTVTVARQETSTCA